MGDADLRTVATKTIVKRRAGWGDGTFAVGESVEILDRMATPDGWEVTGRQERPYFANVEFFGNWKPDHGSYYSMTEARTAPDGSHDHVPEPRWHEIATEGLPRGEGFYWTWDGRYVALREWMAGTDTENSEWVEDNVPVPNPESITHWQPVVKPAPPTR